MKKALHILVVNSYTGRGGIPKVIGALASVLSERGHNVTVLSQKPVPRCLLPLYRLGYALYMLSLPKDKRASVPRSVCSLRDMYPLPDAVRDCTFSFTDNNLKIQKLRQRLRTLNPDVCVCPLPDGTQLVWAVTLLGSGIPYVYSEHHSPVTIENIFWNRKGRLAAMSGADRIHLLSPSFVESIPDFLRDRVTVIPNLAPVPPAYADPAGVNKSRKVVLWLARLHEELKQCRLAMDAFAAIAEKNPDWDMNIVGDGPDRAMVKAHAAKLGLGSRISLLGHADDVWPHYRAAQLYCFSSRTEGMPNSILEAMSCGLPVVAFAACDGMTDLIKDGVNGCVVQEMTAQALAEKLNDLMHNAPLRQRLGEQAKNVSQEYSEQTVFDAWEALLHEAAQAKGNTVMDGFAEEPFASMARLSSVARREWLWRDFGGLMPGTVEAFLYWALWEIPRQWWRRLIV